MLPIIHESPGGIRCALALAHDVMAAGTNVRIGVHIGEAQTMDDEIGGLAVHVRRQLTCPVRIASPINHTSRVRSKAGG